MPRPALSDLITNWRASDATVAEKLAMFRKNTAIKARNQSPCCGNHGEVGC